MKQVIIILTIIFLAACGAEKNNGQTENQAGEKQDQNSSGVSKISGERIDGPANIRDAVNGKIILTLNDNVLVETAPEEGNWNQIVINVTLTQKQQEELKIYANTDLYSTDGQIIGKTLETVELWTAYGKTGLLSAYTHADNIKKHTVPEVVFENEIQQGHVTRSGLGSFIEAFNFIDIGMNPDLKFNQLYIFESTVVDPSPRDRITLFFDKNENLVCAAHSRRLNLSEFKTYELVRGHSLTVFANLDKKEIQRIIDERINFYNSVD